MQIARSDDMRERERTPEEVIAFHEEIRRIYSERKAWNRIGYSKEQ